MDPRTPTSRPDPKATGTRHWVLFFAVTVAIITYIDRVCISKAAPIIQTDLQISEKEMGYAFAAFAWAYALFEIPGGWLADWIGPRKVLTRIVLWWSVFTAATGWVRGLQSLLIVRFLFGAGEAGCFPNLAKIFTTWFPPGERSRAIGIMWISARWGGAITPLIVVWFFKRISWRHAFEVFALLGIFWAIAFWLWFRDRPRDHRGFNAGELALLSSSEANAQGHAAIPWKKFLASKTVWLLWVQYFCFSYGWYFYITWLPTYLQKARGLKFEDNWGAVMNGMPLFFGGIGSFGAGLFLATKLKTAVETAAWRRGFALFGFLVAPVMSIVSMKTANPFLAMLALGAASFALDMALPPAWNTCMDVGGKYAGSLSGSMNMMGNIAGGIAPMVTGQILSSTKGLAHPSGNWAITFWIAAIFYVIGAICWLGIDPVTPLDKKKGELPPQPL